MTRRAYNSCVTEKLAEVRRVLDRYLVEVVEAYDLCPWARPARIGGELAVDVLWGAPSLDAWLASAHALLAQPSTRVAMIVAPELHVTPAELRAIRDAVAARLPSAGIADFHPDAAYDAATPARLVPFIRRSPDPLLQLVPLELLDRVRAYPAVVDLAAQAKILGGLAAPPRGDVADSIAANNHARVVANAAQITATLEDIGVDRRRSYASVGIAV
jgi:hypothetical protein